MADYRPRILAIIDFNKPDIWQAVEWVRREHKKKIAPLLYFNSMLV